MGRVRRGRRREVKIAQDEKDGDRDRCVSTKMLPHSVDILVDRRLCLILYFLYSPSTENIWVTKAALIHHFV